MIEILLISFYVISAILCGYCHYTLTMRELREKLGVINAAVLCARIVSVFLPIFNLIIAVVYFANFLYNTDIKFNIKDKK